MSMFLAASTLLLTQAGGGQEMLAKHVSTLSAAKSLTVTYSVEHIPAAAEDYKLVLSRPGMVYFESPQTLIVGDGKNVWEYNKLSNEYIESQGSLKEALTKIGGDETYAWAAFFLPDQFKGLKDVTVGKKIRMKGTEVTEVKFTIDSSKNKTAIIYFDPTLGAARGSALRAARTGDPVETLVKAKDIQISGAEADAATFAFSAPKGAKKVEITSADLTRWYHDLEEGMKVAKATNRMVFVDFNATWCGPCQMYKRNVFPTAEFQAMAKYFVFVDIDTDEQPALAKKFGATAIPDLHFLKNDGSEVHRVIGYKGMALLQDFELARSKG
jgi:thiol-disulfide isomerase/thioredoxin